MTTSSVRTLRAVLLIVTVAFLFVHLLFVLFPNVFEPWNAQMVDQLFSLRARSEMFQPKYDSTIVHVDISDRTFAELEHSYLNRAQYARVIANLAAMNTKLQIWDFILPARTSAFEDSMLISAVANTRNTYFGLAFKTAKEKSRFHQLITSQRTTQYLQMTLWRIQVEGDVSDIPDAYEPKMTFSALASVSRGLGFINLDFDRDGVYRRVPLLYRHEGAFYPSFSFRAACDFLGVTPDRVILSAGSSVTLKGARRGGGQPQDIVIPVNDQGEMIVNFIGPLHRNDSVSTMRHVDFAEILRASDDRTDLEDWAASLEGKIAVVSEVATGASDVGPVPTDNQFPLSGVHSNAINTILTENFLTAFSWEEMALIEIALLVIIVVLALKFSSRNFSVGAILLMLSYMLLVVILFLFTNTILVVLRPVLHLALAAFGIIAYRYINEQKEKQALQHSFEAYFPPGVVKKIMENPAVITERGQKKELTILFSDIKSFTTYSSTMTPDQIQRLLNEYFGAMVEIVFKHEGTVDKFIGDGLMVFFGDPEDQPDHALRCVNAAIEMQQKCRELKEKYQREYNFPLKIRIGINTGTVAVGNMGSERRLSYTVLGSDVNLAQRLESNAPVEGIMISRRTFELVAGTVPTRPLPPIRVKGLEETPIEVYEVMVE